MTARGIEGKFELSNDAKGVIKIFRFLFTNFIIERNKLAQVFAREIFIDYPLKVYKNDINEIIKKMQELATPAGTLIISESSGNIKKIRYANEYLDEKEHNSDIDSLSFTSQVIKEGFANTITLTLNRKRPSNIMSQSSDMLWSSTAHIYLHETLSRCTNKLLGFYKVSR